MTAWAAWAALSLFQPAPAASAAPDYVDGFCAPVAGGYAEGSRFNALLAEWKARPGSTADGDALNPRDAPAPGQLMRFAAAPQAGPDAPVAFVDPRSGECALVWPTPEPPPAALGALREGSLPVGPGGAAQGWLKVAPVYAGRPPPPRWLLPIGDAGNAGVCAELRTDLARRDGQPASLLRLHPCRLGADERVTPR